MFFPKKLKNEKLTAREVSSSRFIPYKCHFSSNTILTNDNSLLRVIKVRGFAAETADDIDIDLKKNIRNNILKGLDSSNISIRFYTIRRKERGFPDGDMPDKFTDELNKTWASRHSNDRTFINEHYIAITRNSFGKGIEFFTNIFKKFKQKANKNIWEKDIMEMYDELNEITERIINSFINYSPRLLDISENNGLISSEILEFLSRLVNCGYTQNIPFSKFNVANQLPLIRLFFKSKIIEANYPITKKYAGIVSVKEYRPSTSAGVFDGFMQMPFELIITQSFSYTDRMSAIASMQLQQRRLVQSEDVAISQIQEIDQALDSAMSGDFAFGLHHATILCIENSPKALESALSMAVVELANNGISGVREKINLEAAYWGQLPSNDSFLVRRSTINTLNLASFASFHNYPSGKRDKNHWGNAVTVLKTISGTPYFFNFHVRDVGHTMIVGPTGAGKTVLLNFLCAQAQKFRGRLFFFDKDRGAEIFIRAIRGKYLVPDAAKVSGFNPFQLEDNRENRTFLTELLKVLVSEPGKSIPPQEIERINDAVEGNYKLPKEQRRLKNIAPFMGMGGPGSLSSRLEMWHSNGSHARLFDNDEDRIDFSTARNFGIEMGAILQDKSSIAPVLMYLFHKIQQSLDGTPTMIVLDEAWALIDNPVFAPKIKDWLKVLRKLNTIVVFATQSVEDASKSSISDTLVQQTATQIFLPNLKATDVYMKVFMLSEREYTLIKTTDPASRLFLIKQDNDGVLARVDLSGMDNLIKVLSGRIDTVLLLRDIIKEYGDDPDIWLPIFYERT